MNIREKFVKTELEKIYQVLNNSYEFCSYSILQNDKRFLKIFELLFEINDKANVLRQLFNLIIKWKISFSKRYKKRWMLKH